jgi:hypothetical protein
MIPSTLPVNLYIDGLDNWKWAIDGEIRPIAVSAFGDWFYEKRDGKVYSLSILDGTEAEVSLSIDAFAASLKEVAFRDRWLLEAFVERCNRENVAFNLGQCLGWKLQPITGGKFEFSNIGVYDYKVYWNIVSQIVKQVRGII